MLISPDVMRALLLLCLIGMALLAAFYLRQRSLSIYGYLGYGLLILLIPVLGPFLVILSRPGIARTNPADEVIDSKFKQPPPTTARERRERRRERSNDSERRFKLW
jgi:hypothetical protein